MRNGCALLSSLCCAMSCIAAPVAPEVAADAAIAWIQSGDTLGTALDVGMAGVEQVVVNAQSNAFHVVKLESGGYVAMADDDRLEPVLAFSDAGEWNTTSDNPLLAFLSREVDRRHAAIGGLSSTSGPQRLRAAHSQNEEEEIQRVVKKNNAKWRKLLDAKSNAMLSPRLLAAGGGVSSVSDIRVPRLVKSTWDQGSIGIIVKDRCYNYYTPNGYPCGCVATAMAQVMRYHMYPTDYVEPISFLCRVKGEYESLTMKGGCYDWDNMTLSPGDSLAENKRKAIGRLTYDAGVSVGMEYAQSGSMAYMMDVPSALMEVFGYASAKLQDGCIETETMANLDAGCPVIWGISGKSSGHAVVVDGYGYSSDTWYVHVNLGWSGSSNAWYNPDDGITSSYSSIDECVVDIFPTAKDKVIVSGRVLSEAGTPVAGAQVIAEAEDGAFCEQSETNEKGIWNIFVPKSNYAKRVPIRFQAVWNGHVLDEGLDFQTYSASESGHDFTIPELAEAVDCLALDQVSENALVFSTGSAAPWFRQHQQWTSGGDAAQSGAIGHSSESWMETSIYAVNGGKLSFWWNASSEPDYDKLNFSIDGEVVASISGTNNEWTCESFVVTNRWVEEVMESGVVINYWDGGHLFRWSYVKDKAVASGSDCGWVDCVRWQDAVPMQFSSSDRDHFPGYYFSTNIVLYAEDQYGELPAPERIGYTLAGWFSAEWRYDADTGEPSAVTNWLSSTSIVSNSQISWTASWTPNTYFVLFDSNSEGGQMTAQRHVYDSPLRLSKNQFQRKGYEFRGWSSRPDGGVEFEDLSVVTNLTSQAFGTFILYAVWCPTTLTSKVPVPHDWLEYHGLVRENDYEAAAISVAANGRDKVWECYVAGLDPTNATSEFMAIIAISNDVPYITWSPNLNTNGVVRKYTILGKESLTDNAEWAPTNSMHRFFKVRVEMP